MELIDDELAQRRLRAMVHERLFGTPAAPLRIGRYRVIRRLGVGAMGTVYAALDESLGRTVALKVLHAHLAEESGMGRARLIREARALARLAHPNVVALHEVGTHEGQIFLAMEHVAGQTLGAWLREAQPSWPAIVAAFIAAGRGLEAAHAAGLVHRDFKPDNVLVDRTGRVRVLDFGLVRPDDPGAAGAAIFDDDELGPLTRSGVIIGTPAYMSPEQLRGEALDPRSDLFSFCVALHEALLGHRPCDLLHEAGLREVSLAIGAGTPARGRRRLPRRLRRALDRGLARDRERRTATMEPLLRELTAWATPSLGRWEPWIAALIGVAALGVLVAIGFGVEGGGRGGDWLPRIAHLRLVGEHARVRSVDPSGDVAAARVARDRRRMAIAEAWVAVDPSAAAVVLSGLEAADVDGDDPELARIVDAIFGEALVTREAWAPADAAMIGFTGGTIAWSLAGGALTRVDLDMDVGGVSAAPERLREGVRVLALNDEAVLVAGDDGSVERWRAGAAPPERLAEAGPAIVALAARGASAAWIRGDGAIFSVDPLDGVRIRSTVAGADALAIDAGAERIAIRHGSRVTVIGGRASVEVVHPGVTRFALAPGGALVTADDAGGIQIVGPGGERLVQRRVGAAVDALAWSPEDRLAIAAGEGLQIWGPPWTAPRRLKAAEGRISALAWIDGDRLVGGGEDGRVGVWSIAAGRKIALLRGHRAPIVALAAGPSADEILVASADGDLRRWRRGAASTVLERRLGEVSAIAIDPRGRRASAGVDGSLHLWGDAGGDAGERPPDHRIRGRAAIQTLALGPSWVAAGDVEGGLVLLRWSGADPPERALMRRLSRARAITALALSDDQQWLAIGDADGGLRLVDLGDTAARPRVLHPPRAGGPWIMSLSFETGSSRLLVGRADGEIFVGDAPRPPARIAGLGPGLRVARWDPADASIVAAGEDGWIWRLPVDGDERSGGARAARIGHHPPAVWDLVVVGGGDGPRIASAGVDGSILLWSRGARGPLALRGHRGEVLGLAVEPGGADLLSAGQDGTIRRWPLGLRAQRARLAELAAVCLSPAQAQRLADLGTGGAPICRP